MNESGIIINTISNVQPKESGAAEEKSNDEIVQHFSEMILQKIIKYIDPDRISQVHFIVSK